VAPDNAAPCRIVRRDFEFYSIARDDPDQTAAAHLARGAGYDLVAGFETNPESGIAEGRYHDPLRAKDVV